MPISKASSSAVAPGAKGDLVVGNATNDSGILAVGSANQVLTVDSSTATGLKWATPGGAGANYTLLNAGGTSLTGTTTTVSGISGADKILVLVQSASLNSPSKIGVRFNGDTASNYNMYGGYMKHNVSYSVLNQGRIGGADDMIILAEMANNAGGTVSGYVLAEGCNSSGKKVYTFAGGAPTAASATEMVNQTGGGFYDSSSVITSVSVYGNGNTLDAGTVFVYTSA